MPEGEFDDYFLNHILDFAWRTLPVKEEIASSEIDTNPLMAILHEGQSHDHPYLMLE